MRAATENPVFTEDALKLFLKIGEMRERKKPLQTTLILTLKLFTLLMTMIIF